MLLRLLRTYLAKYRNILILVVFLQLAQALASLYLPSLNADIIDNGVGKKVIDDSVRIRACIPIRVRQTL